MNVGENGPKSRKVFGKSMKCSAIFVVQEKFTEQIMDDVEAHQKIPETFKE